MILNRIALAADPERVGQGILNMIGSVTPAFWRGSDLQVDFAAFDTAAGVLRNISAIASVTLRVKAGQTQTDELMSKTIYAADLNPDLTLEQWKDGSSQHGSFSFLGSETNLNLASKAGLRLWMVLVATLTSGAEPVVLAAGWCQCQEANHEAGDPPSGYPDPIILPGPAGPPGIVNGIFSPFMCDAYVGGGAGNLDSLVTAGVALPKIIALVIGGVLEFHQLIASTSGDSPDGTVPIDYDAGTNTKIWIKQL